jgi:conjugative transfer pilus assembly protein TraH
MIMRTFLVSLFLLSGQINAGINTDLGTFFNNLGYMSNTTNPGAYYSQAAGSYSGGSLFARNQVRQYQMIQLDLPSYRAGCGGIDLYMGSMSFLSKDNMVALQKSIMTNGTSYAFDLALATTVPEIKHVTDTLRSVEQFVNNSSINSCELSQNALGGIWPKTQASQDKICKDQGTMGKEGLFSDYVQARMGCSGSKHDAAIEAASKDPIRKKQVVYNKNIVWTLLKSKSFLSKDDELCELIMSLTGTVIIDKNGHVQNVPSLANSRNLVKALIGRDDGGVDKAKIWACGDKDGCMKVSLKEITIAQENTLRFKVSSLINKIKEALRQASPTDKEVNEIASFASMVHIPVVKFTEVMLSTEYGDSIVDLSELSTLIAQDVLQQYLNELLQEVTNVTAGSEFNEDLIKDISKRIATARAEIARLDPEIGNKLQQKFTLINNVQHIEQQVAARVAQELG